MVALLNSDFRIQFKVLVFACRVLHGQTPECISDPSRSLRSSGQGLVVVYQACLKTKGDCALWLFSVVTVDSFKKWLKTHLLSLMF